MEKPDEERQKMQDAHLRAVGHLCGYCHRVLNLDDMITAQQLGPLTIYFHTACIFPEDVVEQMYAEAVLRHKPKS